MSARDLPPAESSEDDLLRQIAAGNREAFGRFYDLFSTPLYSLALRILQNEAEAQDLVQDVFLSLWSGAAARYKPELGRAFSWVITLLRNRAIDRIRMRQRRSDLIEEFGADLKPGEAQTSSAPDQVLQRERGQQVRQALSQITAEQQEVLSLAYFEGLTQPEIAEKLEEPLGTIKARTHRGLARLRNLLRSTRA